MRSARGGKPKVVKYLDEYGNMRFRRRTVKQCSPIFSSGRQAICTRARSNTIRTVPLPHPMIFEMPDTLVPTGAHGNGVRSSICNWNSTVRVNARFENRNSGCTSSTSISSSWPSPSLLGPVILNSGSICNANVRVCSASSNPALYASTSKRVRSYSAVSYLRLCWSEARVSFCKCDEERPRVS